WEWLTLTKLRKWGQYRSGLSPFSLPGILNLIQDLVLKKTRFWIEHLQNDCFFQPLAVRNNHGVVRDNSEGVRVNPEGIRIRHAAALSVLGLSDSRFLAFHQRPQASASQASLYQLTALQASAAQQLSVPGSRFLVFYVQPTTVFFRRSIS
ncbi:MAG: hypothetical protein PWQ07_1056, partial [Kosmotoga sp.]|nr:hypothetical protein [Kosmotoga sp.]